MRYPWARLVGAGLLGAATEAAGLALMATATWLLMTAAGQPPITALTVAIVAVRALAIGRGTLRYAERLAGHDAVLRIVTDVRARIFARLIDRPLSRNADALSRMVSDVDAVQDLVVRVALPAAASGLVAASAVTVVFLFSPAAGLMLLAGLLVSGVAVPALAIRLAHRGAARLAPLRAAYAVTTVDLIHGAADLAAYGAAGRLEAVGAAQAAELSTVERRLARRAFTLDTLATATTGLTAIGVLVVATAQGVPAVWTATLAVGALAAGELATNVLTAARKWAEIREGLRRVDELIGSATGPSFGTAPAPRTAADQAPFPVAGPRLGGGPSDVISLRGVGVVGRLAGIDLDVRPGSRIAVVGPSGAGKSTLLGVIAGAIKPDAGVVDGAGAAYSRATGLMADAHVFHASLRDNLLLAKPDATDTELMTAAEIAGLGEFVSRYPLDLILGEDGAEVSGGQRQRVALARAVLARPPVLLLDEPTEALDPAQADEVLRRVLDDAGDRAVVLVTHWLDNLDQLGLDEIVMMDEGRIVSPRPTH